MLDKIKYLNPFNLVRSFVSNLYFNKCIDFKRLILISFDTKIEIAKTAKIIMEKGSKLNFGYLEHVFSSKNSSKLLMEENSKLIVKKGNAVVKKGCCVYIAKDKTLEIGENTVFVANSKILAYEDIKVGNNCIIGWETHIMSGDGHDLLDENNQVLNNPKTIILEDNVWVGTRATILKGVTIAKGAIVASNSVVTKDVPPNCVVAGNPAKVVKENIKWKV